MYPDSTPIAYQGALFGTTSFGGDIPSVPCGCGTIFRIDPSGKERVIHRFAGTDGQFPTSGLAELNGTFYGVTPQGGGTRCLQGKGCGTIFSVTPDGTESVIHRFEKRDDGTHPSARVLAVGATLYGTTDSGGKGCALQHGCGTVFALQL